MICVADVFIRFIYSSPQPNTVHNEGLLENAILLQILQSAQTRPQRQLFPLRGHHSQVDNIQHFEHA